MCDRLADVLLDVRESTDAMPCELCAGLAGDSTDATPCELCAGLAGDCRNLVSL